MRTISKPIASTLIVALAVQGLLPACGAPPIDADAAGPTAEGDSLDTDYDVDVARSALRNVWKTQDYDGDGRADPVVFRPGNTTWYVDPTSGAADIVGLIGTLPTDRLMPGQYRGNGRTQMAYYRPSTGYWYVDLGTALQSTYFGGATGDEPFIGDFDGDGKTDFGIWRANTSASNSEGKWYVRRSGGGDDLVMPFGTRKDRKVPADYDGDGKTDHAVWRPLTSASNSEGQWFIRPSAGGADIVVQFGIVSDRLVPGDYDGDGKFDIAVFRPSEGKWYLRYSSNGATPAPTAWGEAADRVLPADWNGDGKYDFALFRPRDGKWYVKHSVGTGTASYLWGNPTDHIPHRCGQVWEPACENKKCIEGTPVGGLCKPIETITRTCHNYAGAWTGAYVESDIVFKYSNTGAWYFHGSLYNNLFDADYDLGFVLNTALPGGKKFGQTHSDEIDTNESFTETGYDGRLIDNWETIKSSGITCSLSWGTSLSGTGEAILVGLGLVASAGVVTLLGYLEGEDRGAWVYDENGNLIRRYEWE